MSEENTPVTTTESEQETRFENPFDAIAYLLMTVRLALENGREENSLPRYVRIARAKEVIETHGNSWIAAPAEWTKSGVGILNLSIYKLIGYTLDAKDLLKSADSTIALAEVALEMMAVIADGDFWNAVGKSFEPIDPQSTDKPDVISGTEVVDAFTDNPFDIEKVREWLDYVPQPEDLDRIGHELYRMACMIYNNEGKLDLANAGRLRLLQFTFDQEWGVDHSGNNVEVEKLGVYMPTKGTYGISTHEQIYDPPKGGSDILLYKRAAESNGQESDLTEMLKALNYQTSDNGKTLEQQLKFFQKKNGISTQEALGTETMNRLFNLDFEEKNIKRAIGRKNGEGYGSETDEPQGYFGMINPNAEDYDDEKIELKTREGFKYAYYRIRTETSDTFKDNPGWKAAEGPGYVKGFLGVESRLPNINRTAKEPLYDGGITSEGEAAGGKYFFAARLTEPWQAGRQAAPKITAYGESDPKVLSPNSVARMYQDVKCDIEKLVSDHFAIAPTPANYTLELEASCLLRSLYADRSGSSKFKNEPDQGRILLEVLDGEGNAVTLGAAPKIDDNKSWQPSASVSTAYLNDVRVNQRNNWFKITSGIWSFDLSKIISNNKYPTYNLRVIVEGRHRSGWDIDAYFDEIRLKWRFNKG